MDDQIPPSQAGNYSSSFNLRTGYQRVQALKLTYCLCNIRRIPLTPIYTNKCSKLFQLLMTKIHRISTVYLADDNRKKYSERRINFEFEEITYLGFEKRSKND